MNNFESFLKRADDRGYLVNVQNDYFVLQSWTEVGENFVFDFDFKDGYELLIKSLEIYKNQTVDDYAEPYFLIRGKNGVPEKISDILKSREECISMYQELYDLAVSIQNGYNNDTQEQQYVLACKENRSISVSVGDCFHLSDLWDNFNLDYLDTYDFLSDLEMGKLIVSTYDYSKLVQLTLDTSDLCSITVTGIEFYEE